jgi:hypothetical protein
MLKTIGAATVFSSVLVLPLMTLQLVNRSDAQQVPFVLFALLWLLPFMWWLLLVPTVEASRRLRNAGASLIKLLPSVATLALMAWFWTGVVVDQMPCFLGVPNCD